MPGTDLASIIAAVGPWRRRLADHGVAVQAFENVRFIELVPRLSRLHGDAAQRTGTNDGTRRHTQKTDPNVGETGSVLGNYRFAHLIQINSGRLFGAA
jgi:hypothetical protein